MRRQKATTIRIASKSNNERKDIHHKPTTQPLRCPELWIVPPMHHPIFLRLLRWRVFETTRDLSTSHTFATLSASIAGKMRYLVLRKEKQSREKVALQTSGSHATATSTSLRAIMIGLWSATDKRRCWSIRQSVAMFQISGSHKNQYSCIEVAKYMCWLFEI
jgi:hypothetical protein